MSSDDPTTAADAPPQRAPIPFALPADDASLSPVTGWTRAHWEAVADRWLSHVERYSTGDGARPRLPGRMTWAGVPREGMETVARSFLLAAPRIAGGDDAASDRLAERYARALLAGTRPDGPEAWPLGVACRTPLAGVTQSIVEAAHIAFALNTCRDTLWAGLTRPEQRQIAGWLRHHGRLETWQNNWQLFPAMCEGFLAAVGEDTSGCLGARGVARVEGWYLGDGWYTDGPDKSVDYYNAWTIHPFLWEWYRMTDRTGTPEAERHRDRLREFVGSYTRMIADDGSVVHVGRSLTYRTAVLAALWCAEISGDNPLSPGQTRAVASSVLKNFVEHGVGIDEPLSLGWYDEHEPTTQSYSGYGSPYLAGLGFQGLALPASAAVWAEAEEPSPTAGEAFRTSWSAVGWRLDAAGDGIVRLANHGSDHCWLPVEGGLDPDDPHYAKLAYSTHTAPGTGEAWADDVDSHIALIADDGRASRRCAIRATRVSGDVAGSVHLPQRDGALVPGAAITTVSLSDGALEVRAHRVVGGPHVVREGGYAIADRTPPETGADAAGAWARREDGLYAAVVPLIGWGADAAGIAAHRDANAMGRHSATPFLLGRAGEGTTVFATLHVLAAAGGRGLGAWSDSVSVSLEGDVLEVRWPSGRSESVDLATFVPWDGRTA